MRPHIFPPSPGKIAVDRLRPSCYNILAFQPTGLGEMSEGLKELVLKTSDAARHRGFESHSLRQFGRQPHTSALGEVLKYGRRGAPAKGVGRETGARVQIPPSPPKKYRNFDTMGIKVAVLSFLPESPDFKDFRAFIMSVGSNRTLERRSSDFHAAWVAAGYRVFYRVSFRVCAISLPLSRICLCFNFYCVRFKRKIPLKQMTPTVLCDTIKKKSFERRK